MRRTAFGLLLVVAGAPLALSTPASALKLPKVPSLNFAAPTTTTSTPSAKSGSTTTMAPLLPAPKATTTTTATPNPSSPASTPPAGSSGAFDTGATPSAAAVSTASALPRTGGPSPMLPLTGAALILGGVVLVGTSARKEREL